jgi:SAM-dependent methyltransferase
LNNETYTNLLIIKNPIRRFVRKYFFIRNLLKFIDGKTLDFGCGVGEILKFMPPGSMGLDNNKSSINYCLNKGLVVRIYRPEIDRYNFNFIKPNSYKTLLMNHVLEHLDNPKKTLSEILKSANQKKIGRVVIVVPGRKGFEADQTHVEFIDHHFFSQIKRNGYKIIYQKYYPIDNVFLSNLFRYQEFITVLEKN